MPTTAERAIENAHDVQRYPRGDRLRFVREQWEVGPLYPSAIEAWNGARWKHPGDRTPPPGAPCFYAGGNYGHIVIWCPPAHPGMRSTDCPSSGNVSDADIAWVERTWGYPYLGWTEDLNGVRVLPPEEDEEMTEKEWDRLRQIVAEEVEANNGAATDAVWAEQVTVTKPNGQEEKKPARQVLRETWQRVTKL